MGSIFASFLTHRDMPIILLMSLIPNYCCMFFRSAFIFKVLCWFKTSLRTSKRGTFLQDYGAFDLDKIKALQLAVLLKGHKHTHILNFLILPNTFRRKRKVIYNLWNWYLRNIQIYLIIVVFFQYGIAKIFFERIVLKNTIRSIIFINCLIKESTLTE